MTTALPCADGRRLDPRGMRFIRRDDCVLLLDKVSIVQPFPSSLPEAVTEIPDRQVLHDS